MISGKNQWATVLFKFISIKKNFDPHIEKSSYDCVNSGKYELLVARLVITAASNKKEE